MTYTRERLRELLDDDGLQTEIISARFANRPAEIGLILDCVACVAEYRVAFRKRLGEAEAAPQAADEDTSVAQDYLGDYVAGDDDARDAFDTVSNTLNNLSRENARLRAAMEMLARDDFELTLEADGWHLWLPGGLKSKEPGPFRSAAAAALAGRDAMKGETR